MVRIKRRVFPLKLYFNLVWQLALREIKARYKQSVVGPAWVILNPLLQLVIYTFLFSVLAKFPTGNVPYVIFLFAGLLPWTFLQSSVGMGTESLIDNSVLLKKVYFPREIIPLSIILAKFVDFIFASCLFLVLSFIMGVPIHLTIFFVLPLIIIEVILIAGVSLLLSLMNLYYRDIHHLSPLILMIWMYATPVVYPFSIVPSHLMSILYLNPMVGVIEGYRSALFGLPLNWPLIGFSAISSCIIFMISWWLFKHYEGSFADVV